MSQKSESRWTKGAATWARRRESVPRQYLKLYDRVVGDGKGNRRECVKVMCLECMGFERGEVARCSATACPLFRFRPYGTDSKGANPHAGKGGSKRRIDVRPSVGVTVGAEPLAGQSTPATEVVGVSDDDGAG